MVFSIKNQFQHSSIIISILLSCLISSVVFVANPYQPDRTNARAAPATLPAALEFEAQPEASTIYLPYISQQPNPGRALGTISKLSGPTQCDTTTGQTCYDVRVTCPEVSLPLNATLKVGDPTTQENKGTILFYTGGTGTYYWENAAFAAASNNDRENAQSLPILPDKNNPAIIANLRVAGYRTVQVKWYTNWFEAQLNYPEGMARLACRPATVARWVYENLHNSDIASPFCATGHSNGATQVSFMLTHYGLQNILSATVLESGPNWSYIDYACLPDNPTYAYLFAADSERKVIDWGFGFPNDGSGPCARQDTSWRNNFQQASVIGSLWNYSYAKTYVAFLFGGNDTGTTALQGKEYYSRLVTEMTPWISTQTVPGAGHYVTGTTAGAQAMEDLLKQQCILR